MTAQSTKSCPLPLSIAIPSSFIDVYSSNAQKTQQIGRIARAAAIFQVDEIIVYLDRQNHKQRKNNQLISLVLTYMETPQYLRKHLFDRIPELRYVGLLPPLRTPHHPLGKVSKVLKTDEIREGYAFFDKGRLVVDIGIEAPLPLLKAQSLNFPTRLTVRITRNKEESLVAYPCTPPRTKRYWGYQVIALQSLLGEFLANTSNYKFIVATTRKGTLINTKMDLLHQQWRKANRLLLLFGSHKEGLSEIFAKEDYSLSSLTDYSINLLPHQGVATIRTEEAVFIGLTGFRILEQK
jgi:predicted SPOUT superfamily RNA methylase MTH1